jgi:hypothetical protein
MGTPEEKQDNRDSKGRLEDNSLRTMAQQRLMGQRLLIIETSRSHYDTPQSVGLLWTSDQPDAETTT